MVLGSWTHLLCQQPVNQCSSSSIRSRPCRVGEELGGGRRLKTPVASHTSSTSYTTTTNQPNTRRRLRGVRGAEGGAVEPIKVSARGVKSKKQGTRQVPFAGSSGKSSEPHSIIINVLIMYYYYSHAPDGILTLSHIYTSEYRVCTLIWRGKSIFFFFPSHPHL